MCSKSRYFSCLHITLSKCCVIKKVSLKMVKYSSVERMHPYWLKSSERCSSFSDYKKTLDNKIHKQDKTRASWKQLRNHQVMNTAELIKDNSDVNQNGTSKKNTKDIHNGGLSYVQNQCQQ